MKFFAALVLVTFSAVSVASDRDIYDLMYLPKAGTNFGITEFAYTKAKASGEVVGFDFDLDAKIWQVKQSLGRSLTDNFAIWADINYTNQKVEQILTGQDDVNTDTKGLSDPSLSARYRVMDETLRFDVIGRWTIKSGDARTNQDGDSNLKQGGHSILGGLELGQKWQDFQWSTCATYGRYLESTSVGGDRIKDDPYNQWTFAGEALARVSENSFLRGLLGFEFTDSYEDNDTPVDKTSAQTIYKIGTEYQYLFSQDLLGKAGLQRWEYNQDTGVYDELNLWLVNIGATYQF